LAEISGKKSQNVDISQHTHTRRPSPLNFYLERKIRKKCVEFVLFIPEEEEEEETLSKMMFTHRQEQFAGVSIFSSIYTETGYIQHELYLY
jgi:hypothetical protein